mmetsp:Transcript_41295/g.108419  ORF Transcript_41295/g.108419 Transcript_41295/m.108419 type:complete len:212 (-) Transcript_41295:729-1364(-)
MSRGFHRVVQFPRIDHPDPHRLWRRSSRRPLRLPSPPNQLKQRRGRLLHPPMLRILHQSRVKGDVLAQPAIPLGIALASGVGGTNRLPLGTRCYREEIAMPILPRALPPPGGLAALGRVSPLGTAFGKHATGPRCVGAVGGVVPVPAAGRVGMVPTVGWWAAGPAVVFVILAVAAMGHVPVASVGAAGIVESPSIAVTAPPLTGILPSSST